MIAPTLSTDRLTLRPHTKADFPAYAEMYASPRSHMMDGPLDTNRAWFALAHDAGGWALCGFGAWAIERRQDHAFVGQVGLQHPPAFPEKELGWVLFDGFEGNGFATEAAWAAKRYAFDTLEFDTLVSYMDPRNSGSISVAERLGARQDFDAAVPDAGDIAYRHSAKDARC